MHGLVIAKINMNNTHKDQNKGTESSFLLHLELM